MLKYLDNKKKQRRYLSSMNNECARCALTTIQNKLFVFGGEGYSGFLNSNEIYELDNNNNE